MRSVHKTNTTVVVIYFKHEGKQIEEAQLEEQVYEQVDDEGTKIDDGEGIDTDDVKALMKRMITKILILLIAIMNKVKLRSAC
ncbi:unnamed protein product [Prunus brigantina]